MFTLLVLARNFQDKRHDQSRLALGLAPPDVSLCSRSRQHLDTFAQTRVAIPAQIPFSYGLATGALGFPDCPGTPGVSNYVLGTRVGRLFKGGGTRVCRDLLCGFL